ncbi:MAG: amidohydrolase family protein [Pseudomonadota bacterium]
MTGIGRRTMLGALATTGALGLAGRSFGQAAVARAGVLFRNVRVFDGRSPKLSPPSDVLVRGNLIDRISTEPIPLTPEVREIAGGGRTLIPGLIDAHWHAFMAGTSQPVLMSADIGYLNLMAAQQAEATLMRGFTTVRDLGGPVFGLKQAIDEGATPGPRIYPCGAMISQTSGHGDFRFPFELPRTPGGPVSHSEAMGVAAIADSADEVRLRAREQLRLGASQIKLMAGGGVSSPHNPIESTQFSEAEIRAAVEAAENWGTYVTTHTYTPRAIRQALAAGVRCIDHGQLTDEATAQLIADKGVWWSLQPLTYNAEVFARMSPFSQAKAREVFAGTETAYGYAIKHRVKTAWGSDILFDAGAAARQGSYLAMMIRWYSPAAALSMATAANAELLAMSGFSNPYPGKLGVVQPGALADLLLVEGDPLQTLELVADPDRNFRVIMKDGVVFKDTVPA